MVTEFENSCVLFRFFGTNPAKILVPAENFFKIETKEFPRIHVPFFWMRFFHGLFFFSYGYARVYYFKTVLIRSYHHTPNLFYSAFCSMSLKRKRARESASLYCVNVVIMCCSVLYKQRHCSACQEVLLSVLNAVRNWIQKKTRPKISIALEMHLAWRCSMVFPVSPFSFHGFLLKRS